jgi:hypothetical protein
LFLHGFALQVRADAEWGCFTCARYDWLSKLFSLRCHLPVVSEIGKGFDSTELIGLNGEASERAGILLPECPPVHSNSFCVACDSGLHGAIAED